MEKGGSAAPAAEQRADSPAPKAKAKAKADKNKLDLMSSDLEKMSRKEIIAVAQRLRSAPKFCNNFAKGTCNKGESCPYAHLDEYSVERHRHADKVRKAISAERKKPAPQ